MHLKLLQLVHQRRNRNLKTILYQQLYFLVPLGQAHKKYTRSSTSTQIPNRSTITSIGKNLKLLLNNKTISTNFYHDAFIFVKENK